MRKGILITFILLFSVTAIWAQRDKKDEVVTVVPEGVIYSLPRTGIRVHVKAMQEKFFHGPYYKYAETLLGIEGAPSQDAEKWTITKIKLETYSEPDPAQVHKAMREVASLISLTESGVIAGINTEVETDEEDMVVSTFLNETSVPSFPFPDLSMSDFYEQGDSTRRNVLMAKSLEEKAVDVAHVITKLRKRRFKTLSNGYEEQLPDGKAYDVMVDELGDLEDEYLALFIGKTYKEKYEYTFEFMPGENGVSGEVVFRFSETKGVLPKTDLSGKPVAIDIKKEESLAAAQGKLKASANPSAGQNGVFYRIPGKAEIRMMNGLNLMATSRATIAQFGEVAPMPENLLNGSYEVKFHPKTGAIKSITSK
ncbi:DUF4831 family protein [Sunxiuqinia sp. A32]|uniref:DUF4831 family protein n=1 Tax=Sunxiuqinia sp. A32 TaxID=3461496 RepID=UPI0040455775